MDLSADTAFANNTRPGTPVPPNSRSVLSSPNPGESSKERRDSNSTIRPTGSEVDQQGVEVKEGSGESGEASGSRLKESTTVEQDKEVGLEKEVGQVVQQLSSWGGSFWGGFRKQADSALDAVKKDFARTVAEAQDEIKQLQHQTASFEVRKPEINLAAIGSAIVPDSITKVDKGKGKEVVRGGEAGEEGGDGEKGEGGATGKIPALPTAKQTQAFFKNLQASLTTEANQINHNLTTNLSSLQKTLSETIANNPSLNQINRANISTLSATIQSNLEKAGTRIDFKQAEKLAEDYLKRGEDMLGEAAQQAGSFLKDAVKVIPPEQGGGESGSYTYSWDGTDVGIYGSADDEGRSNTVLFDRSTAGNELSRSQYRLNALLRRLRSDVELLSQDPSAPGETKARREAFERFKKDKLESKGGWQGAEVQKLVWAEMGPEANDSDVEALKKSKDAMVPGTITEESFWIRYLFHKNNIEDEETKRQQLLQAAQPKEEEDFSWDDAEGENETEPTTQEATPKIAQTEAAAPVEIVAAGTKEQVAPIVTVPAPVATTSPVVESASTSRRQSEESYDIVSETSAGNGAAKLTAVTKDKTTSVPKESKQEDTDGEDSDWE